VEEEVKSNDMNIRPTVYAGMSAKLDRTGSGNGGDGSIYADDQNSLKGGRTMM
jgi:hypothetical protein